MLRVVDYQRVDLNDQEYAQYQALVSQLGEDAFRGLITTDDRGIITMIAPNRVVSWAVVFWAQMVMVNGQLRAQDAVIADLQRQLNELKG